MISLLPSLKMGGKSPNPSKQAIFIFVAIFVALIWFWQIFGPHSFSSPHPSKGPYKHSRIRPKYWSASSTGNLEGIRTWDTPEGLNKVVGIVFYGRPATVSILDCYLKRNLVKNGGMLDEVAWIVRTNKTEDKAWLDVLLKSEPAYSKWDVKFGDDADYRSAYDRVENGTMYIKIDDDIVCQPLHCCPPPY